MPFGKVVLVNLCHLGVFINLSIQPKLLTMSTRIALRGLVDADKVLTSVFP